MIAAPILCLALLAADPARAIDFDSEIVPVLTKAGCNAGACHGAAAGRGGLHLSLLGGDPSADYDAIVHALEGRRVNLAKPSASLIFKKPAGYLDHSGEVALPEAGAGAQRLLTWIEQGAPRGVRRKLQALTVSPSLHVSEQLPATVKLSALARFDGDEEDVTPFTVFTSADPSAVKIDADSATATILRRGQHVVIARFLDQVVALRLIAPLGDAPVDHAAAPRANFIDDEILRTLTTLRLPVTPPADDATYLRRVRLDLTVRLPSPEEVRDYLADHSSDKRMKLVNRLLASEEFNDYWTLRFARVLRLHSLPGEKQGVETYANWLRQQIADQRPLNAWAAELLTATGDSHTVGPANFHRMTNDARAQAELVGEFFLGAKLGCANCHNHPLDRWTQDDYHGLAAVFAKLERGRIVGRAARGGVTNLRTGEPAIPRLPGLRDLTGDGDTIGAAATWLTSRDNPQFAQAAVNRLWRDMFGRGLVEPADDLRATNPATHPELLDKLAEDFAAHDYDLRHTLRTIALSNTYARGATDGGTFYASAPRRPLGPEVLADAIRDVTGVPDAFADAPPGTRAVSLVDPLSPAPALDILGRCNRAAGCEEGTGGGDLPRQLHLINGELINRKLAHSEGRLSNLIDAGADDAAIVTEFYRRGLSREPTGDELQSWVARLATKDAAERRARLEDFVWSLLNSRDFTENH